MAAANDLGATLGSEASPRVGSRAGRDRLLEAAATVLVEQGFEPRAGGKGCLVLGNCPFSPVAGEYMDLVCQANLALIQGLASELQIKGVDIFTMGQYLAPTGNHHPVRKYWTPEEFAELGEKARAMGFHHVESAPLVRSSYMAHRALK